jgi:hypothetical protein
MVGYFFQIFSQIHTSKTEVSDENEFKSFLVWIEGKQRQLQELEFGASVEAALPRP